MWDLLRRGVNVKYLLYSTTDSSWASFDKVVAHFNFLEMLKG